MHREVITSEYEAFVGTVMQEKRVMITAQMVADSEDNSNMDRRLVLASDYVSLSRQEALEVLHSLISLLTKVPQPNTILAGPSSLVLGANPTPEGVECTK